MHLVQSFSAPYYNYYYSALKIFTLTFQKYFRLLYRLHRSSPDRRRAGPGGVQRGDHAGQHRVRHEHAALLHGELRPREDAAAMMPEPGLATVCRLLVPDNSECSPVNFRSIIL